MGSFQIGSGAALAVLVGLALVPGSVDAYMIIVSALSADAVGDFRLVVSGG